MDVDRLRPARPERCRCRPSRRGRWEAVARGARARIGVARDVAFQFYYPANLDLLRGAGAELVFWSPLNDAELPDVDALYLGGGYPEVHAGRLAANAPMREAVRAFALAGRPVYAECGGLLYLADALEDETGALQPMVGLLPTVGRLAPKRLTLGYAEIEVTRRRPRTGRHRGPRATSSTPRASTRFRTGEAGIYRADEPRRPATPRGLPDRRDADELRAPPLRLEPGRAGPPGPPPTLAVAGILAHRSP